MQIPYEEELCALADAVWETPEPGFREYKSSAAHVEFLKKHGFEVKTDVAKTGTGYEASWGSGHPVIAFLGEFDALYGMNQKADCPSYHPEDPDGMGQGCGHHMLGVGAIAAGMAYREMLKANGGSGTVKIFGCPGEESGSGKAYM
ncbi:MAG: M20/M25/M40 family metallo-hydrolase, partial [Lachnospiraceae bacterium]